MLTKEQWKVLWVLMEASQRLGAKWAMLGDGVSAKDVAVAVEERQQALFGVLKQFGGGSGEV
jgi:hypothetical protein